MKRGIIIASLMFTLALFVSSCVKEYEAPNNGTDVTWYVTGRDEDQNYDPIIIVQDDYLGFMDCSLGATSHMWEVSEDGTYMLSGTPKGQNINFDEYIDESIDHTTTNESIMVLFRKEGLHKVRLLNTFDEPVTYRYKTVQSQIFADEFKAKKVGDQYVIDTTLMVEVYGKTLVPDAKVYSDAQLLNEVKTGTYIDENGEEQNYSYELKFGDKLYFVDNSTYKPNMWSWKCTAAGIGVDEEVTSEIAPLQFNMLSTTEKGFNVILTVTRSADLVENKYISAASSKSLTIPLNIKVVENPVKVVPKVEVAANPSNDTDEFVSAINVTLPNTGFYADQFADTGDGSALSNLIGTISATCGTSKMQCTGIVWSSNTPNVMRVEFGSQIFTSEDIKITFAEDLETTLSRAYVASSTPETTYPGYSERDFMLTKGTYNVSASLFDIPQKEIGDIDYLYKKLCDEAGLSAYYKGGNPSSADLEYVNSSLAFKKALRKVFLCEKDNLGNITADLEIARIDEVTSSSAATLDGTPTAPTFNYDRSTEENTTDYSNLLYDAYDSSKERDILCLKIMIDRTATKLRLGSDYTFDMPAGTYSYSMNMAVALNGNNGNTAPISGGIQAMICDPYPASYAANTFFKGATLEYYSIKSFDTYGSAGKGRWCYYYPEDPIAATAEGFDNSLSLTLSYYEAGTVVYLRDIRVTTATSRK